MLKLTKAFGIVKATNTVEHSLEVMVSKIDEHIEESRKVHDLSENFKVMSLKPSSSQIFCSCHSLEEENIRFTLTLPYSTHCYIHA